MFSTASFCSSMASARVCNRSPWGSSALISSQTCWVRAPGDRWIEMDETLPSGAIVGMSQDGSMPTMVAPAMEAP